MPVLYLDAESDPVAVIVADEGSKRYAVESGVTTPLAMVSPPANSTFPLDNSAADPANSAVGSAAADTVQVLFAPAEGS